SFTSTSRRAGTGCCTTRSRLSSPRGRSAGSPASIPVGGSTLRPTASSTPSATALPSSASPAAEGRAAGGTSRRRASSSQPGVGPATHRHQHSGLVSPEYKGHWAARRGNPHDARSVGAGSATCPLLAVPAGRLWADADFETGGEDDPGTADGD